MFRKGKAGLRQLLLFTSQTVMSNFQKTVQEGKAEPLPASAVDIVDSKVQCSTTLCISLSTAQTERYTLNKIVEEGDCKLLSVSSEYNLDLAVQCFPGSQPVRSVSFLTPQLIAKSLTALSLVVRLSFQTECNMFSCSLMSMFNLSDEQRAARPVMQLVCWIMSLLCVFL